MAIANIFQKLRAQTPATATAALAGFLTLATPFSNATAQEPMRTSHTPQSSNATKHYQPTLIGLANEYSINNKAVGIIVYKGKKDEGGLTGPQIGGMIKNFFDGETITSKPFVGPSTADDTAIGFTLKGILYGPVSLGKVKAMAVIVAHDYALAHDIRPEMPAPLAANRE